MAIASTSEPSSSSSSPRDPLLRRASISRFPTYGSTSVEDEELTEDELVEYEKGVISWDNAKRWRFWFRKEWIWGYVGLAVLAAIFIVMSVLHHKVTNRSADSPSPKFRGQLMRYRSYIG